MRRRTLLAAAGLAAPASLLAGVSDALASIPDPTGSPIPLDSRSPQSAGSSTPARTPSCCAPCPASSPTRTKPLPAHTRRSCSPVSRPPTAWPAQC